MSSVEKELKLLSDDMKAGWDEFKGDFADRLTRIEQRVDEGLGTYVSDEEIVRRQKIGLDTDRSAGSVSPFLALDQSIQSKFAAETPDWDPSQVRLGAMVAAIAGGERIRSQLEAAELHALHDATGPGGGYVVNEIIGSRFIDSVRPRTRVLQAGAGSYPMEASIVHLPGWDELLSARWRREGGAFSPIRPTFRRVTLEAKMVETSVDLSIEWLEDAMSDLTTGVGLIEAEMGRALSQGIDLAALHGSGSKSQPLGLYTLATDEDVNVNVNTVELGSGDGAVPTDYDFVLDALAEAEDANFDPTAIIWSPRTVNTLRKITTGLTSDKTKLEMPEDVAALQRLVTNQVRNDLTVGSSEDECSAAFLGDWSQMVIGFRPDLGIRRLGDPYTGMEETGSYRLYAWLRADVAVLQPQAFTVISGIKASA